jgi:hypothetical protein
MTSIDETKTTSGFEKLLFGFTRVFAIGGSFVALVAIVVLLFVLISSGHENTYVSFSDLRPSQQTEKGNNRNALAIR